MSQEQVPIAEAAPRLGLSEHAVRKRIQRGTLPAVKDPRGKWLVVIGTDGAAEPRSETPPKTTRTDVEDPSQAVQDGPPAIGSQELVEALRSEVEFLRGELTARTEELRRKDHIIAGLTTRIPELGTGDGGRNGPTSAPPASPASSPSSMTGGSARSGRPYPWWQFWRWGTGL